MKSLIGSRHTRPDPSFPGHMSDHKHIILIIKHIMSSASLIPRPHPTTIQPPISLRVFSGVEQIVCLYSYFISRPHPLNRSSVGWLLLLVNDMVPNDVSKCCPQWFQHVVKAVFLAKLLHIGTSTDEVVTRHSGKEAIRERVGREK